MLAKKRNVTFKPSTSTAPNIPLNTLDNPCLKLCQLFSNKTGEKCIGIISHADESYHLHPFTKRKPSDNDRALTLGGMLSSDFEGHFSRRQRCSMALLLASSVAQLQFTGWLRTNFTKEDVLFFPCEDDDYNLPYSEPFIRRDFSINPEISNTDTASYNFYSLGILLLELCFGRRLEDHPLRQR
jgi:hypothetical protein